MIHKKRPRRSGFLRRKELPRSLSFDNDPAPGRAGDLRPADEVADEFPLKREREAGLTGASMPGGGVTADDLSPETLLDDHQSHSPSSRDDRDPFDTVLRNVAESEIGGGDGPDEAEDAVLDPLPSGEHARRQQQANRLRRENRRAK